MPISSRRLLLWHAKLAVQVPDLYTRHKRYPYLGKEEIDVGSGECAAEQLGVAAQLGKLAALHVFHVLCNSNSNSTPN